MNIETIKKYAPFIVVGGAVGLIGFLMKNKSNSSSTTTADTTGSQTSIDVQSVQGVLTEYQNNTNQALTEMQNQTNQAIKDMQNNENSNLQGVYQSVHDMQTAQTEELNKYTGNITDLTKNLTSVNNQNQDLKAQLDTTNTNLNKAYNTISNLQDTVKLITPLQQAGWNKDQTTGDWYYANNNLQKVTNKWEQDSKGKWYYLGKDGAMVTNTITPDGYKVNADGSWDGGSKVN